MKPKLLTTLTAALLALSAWANGTEINGIYYVLDSSTKTASVTSGDSNYQGDITIPSSVTYDGTTYSVTSIGGAAFNNCINLTSIEIPATVTAIKGRAFSGCSKLTCVTINSDPIVSKDYYDTSTLPFYELFGSQVKKYILGEGVTKIGERAFFPGFPNGTSNGNVRFMPTEIEEVYLPSTLRSIGRWAFQFCINLKHVYFQEGLDSIADGAFTYCLSLKNLNIPASLRVLGEGQSWLLACKDITVAKGNQHIVLQDSVLFDSDMTTLLQYPASRESAYYHIPEGVKKVQAWAFEGAGNLKTLIIPSSVKSMGDNWMAYTRPQEIHIENKVPPMSETRVSEDNQNIGNSLLYPSFNFYNDVVLHVPKGSKETYASTAPWSKFANIVDDIDTGSDDAVVLTADGEDVWTDGVLRFSVSSEENGEVAVSGVIDKDDNLGAVTIPEKVKIADKVYSVTTIGSSAFRGCTGLTSVTIGNSVTSVGWYAFQSCTGLTSVTIGNSVTSIGIGAFRDCTGLTSITIPNSVTSIGGSAFADCTGLTSVTIGNSVTSIGDFAFKDCTGLTSITIPSSVTGIGEGAFGDCTGLTSIKVAAGNTRYDSRDNCNAIIETASNKLVVGCKATSIPSSVTSIGDYAFYGCTGLTSITIPSSVTSIDIYAFQGCTGLTSITIPESVTSIGIGAFYGCTGLTSITIPNSVTTIDSGAFAYCSGLTSIKVAAGNTKYDSRDNCNAIIETASNTLVAGCKATTIPSSVTSIGDWTFSGCSGLTSITIPNSVTSIGGSSFEGCTGLTSITIPNSVTTIGDYAFDGCTGLTDIYALRTDPEAYKCSTEAFDNVPTSTCTLHVPSGSKEAYAGTAPWSNFASIVDDIDTGSDDAVVLTADGEDVWTDGVLRFSVSSEENGEAVVSGVKDKDNLGAVTIPEKVKIADKVYSVTRIGGKAFYFCTSLTSIEIPNSVTSIGNEAFYASRLTSVTIPASVRYIGSMAFVTPLTSIKVEAGNATYDSRENCNAIIETESNRLVAGCQATTIPSSVTGIGEYAFFDCYELTRINIPNSVIYIGYYAFSHCSGLTSVSIPESVMSIGDYAFDGCEGLTGVIIPSSVTSIGYRAFNGCTGLTDVTIPSSVTRIGNYAFVGCEGFKYINALRTDPAAYNCATDAFSDYTYSATLYVPSGSKEAYASTEPWSNFANIEEEPIQVGGLLYTIQGNEATCVGTGSVEGWYNWPVENIPERITFDGKEYTVTAVEGVGGGYGSIIVLPKTLKRIGSLSASDNAIICLSPTPPEIESTSVSRCALYVPDEYLEAHRKGWVIDGKLFGNRYNSLDVEAYPNLIPYIIRPMSHLLNYVYDDETMTATINGFRLVTYNGTFTISEALGCTSSRMSSNYRERIWAEQNDINLDWVVPATITKFQYIYAGRTQTRVKTGETYAVKRVEKLLGARSVTLSEGIEEVGPNAFCLDLWPVVTDAEGNAQYYNDPLESVSLPSTLKLLDWFAFCGCTSLKHVEMKEGLDSIGQGVFTYCLSLEDCHLPASLRAMGYGHGNLYSLQAFSTAQGSENIVAKDGVLFSDGGKTLLQYPAGKPDTTYEVPEGTVKLSPWSFEAVQELESIILPASVEEIGGYIFANTHCLKHIYCKSQTPPVLTNGQWWLRGGPRPDDAVLSSYDIYNEVTVHVPTGCKEIYANTIGWKGFNIVEDIDTGIEPLTLTPSEAGQAYYNLQGQRITNPQRGQLVIVRYADGTSRKVVVK